VALFQRQRRQDQQLLELEQFAQITDRFNSIFLAGNGVQPVVDLPPCLRTAEPERLVDIGARLAQRAIRRGFWVSLTTSGGSMSKLSTSEAVLRIVRDRGRRQRGF
jgi:hypothetical protein